jgi:hypothetical protein
MQMEQKLVWTLAILLYQTNEQREAELKRFSKLGTESYCKTATVSGSFYFLLVDPAIESIKTLQKI